MWFSFKELQGPVLSFCFLTPAPSQNLTKGAREESGHQNVSALLSMRGFHVDSSSPVPASLPSRSVMCLQCVCGICMCTYPNKLYVEVGVSRQLPLAVTFLWFVSPDCHPMLETQSHCVLPMMHICHTVCI